MALIHDVIDSDVRFVIDPVTRSISNQGSGKLILIRGDHNSERFSFEIPRFVEGHDMSLCNVVRIHYINTCSKTRATSEDIYEPKDLCISEENPQMVHFSWLISGNATVYAGGLAFAMEFQCTIDDKVEYAWHTGINSTISISDSLINSEAVIENYADILTTWWLRIYANSTMPIEIHTMESFKALNGKTRSNTLYLLEDDPTIEQLLQLVEPLKTLGTMAEDISTINIRLKELGTYSQAIVSIQDNLDKLSSRVSILENGSGNENPDDSDDPIVPEDPDHTHTYSTVVETVSATCDDAGYTLYKCECGATERRDEVAKLGHQLSYVVTAPTCINQGYTTYTCGRSGCTHSYIDAYIPALDHTWSYYQDSSSGETGWSRKCTVCQTVETDAVYGCTVGGEHVWVETVATDATCTSPAYQKYQCSVCNETKQEAIRAPLGHDPQPEVVIDATCTTPAYQRYKCSRCDDHTYDTQIAPALGHDWSEAMYDAVGYYKPTCTEAGLAGHVCKNCGEEKSETIPALQHEFTDIVTAPTCTAGGYTTRKCTRDGCTYSFVVSGSQTAATGHDWDDTPVDSGSGYVYSCKNCDATKDVTEDNCDHTDEVLDTVSATCTADGYTVYKCSICDREEIRDYTPALGHNYNAVVTAPTCISRGYTTHTCSNCGDSYIDSYVNTVSHSWSGWTTTLEATCTTDGEKKRTCSVCGKIDTNTVEALGHDTTYYPGKSATCTEDGYTGYNECKVCGEIIDGMVHIPATGHDYTSEVTDATCTSGGYTTHTCSKCGDWYTSDETDANGHSYPGGWSTVMAATCSEDGLESRTCDECGYTQDRTIPATGHDYEPVEDSNQSSGYVGVCMVCGDVVEDYSP